MNRWALILSLLIPLSAAALDRNPQNIYTGYSYCAFVDTVDTVEANPANLYKLSDVSFLFTLKKPGFFHSFAFTLPLSRTYLAALAVYSLPPDFQKYRMGLSVVEWRYLNFGLTLGVDRLLNPKPMAGLTLAPGFSGQIVNNKRTLFKLFWGLVLHDALAVNQFHDQNSFTAAVLEGGFRAQVFVKNLFLNTGVRWGIALTNAPRIDASVGLEWAPVHALDLGFVARTKKWAAGITLHPGGHNLSFAWEQGWRSGSDFSLTYGYSIQDRPRTARRNATFQKISRQRLTPQIQEKQKQLLDEGLRLYKEKDYEGARKTWKAAIDVYPSSDIAGEARKYIEKVNNILDELDQ